MEQNANEADREVHDFRCKMTPCKIQELHAPGKQPARRMHVQNTLKGQRERVVLYLIEIGNKGESFANHTSFSCFVSGCIFLPGRF